MKLILALATITLLTACGGGDDSNNNTQATTDTPQTPSAPTASVESSSQINLSWLSVSDANYYRLYNGSTEIYTNNGTSYSNIELTANTSYSYTLKACRDDNSNTCSDASSATIATTTLQTPSVPTATVQGAYQIDLSWSAVSGASYYRLYNGSTEIYTNNGTIYNHEGLEANTAYSYTLKACTDSNSNTCSDASSAISATTQEDTQTTPQTPSAPTATIQSYSQINLSWLAVSDANYYRLSRGDDEIYAGSNTIYNNTGLNDNTFYSYTLSTCTDSSINTCSNASSATSATTTQVPSATLNDTGITWGGNYATGNNTTCVSSITVPQDCHQGRDASLTLSVSTFTYATDGSKIAKIGAGDAGFDFTKLSSTGAILPSSADSWSCVKDNITGLIWEVKINTGSADTYTTNDDGTRTYIGGNIHHEDNIYRWGGLSALGREHTSREGNYSDDWDVLVNGSNSEELCGFSDWRVPTMNELDSIAHKGKTSQNIDSNYFPNTAANYFWSASPVANDSRYAWRLNFNDGDDSYNNRTNSFRVRLVRVGE